MASSSPLYAFSSDIRITSATSSCVILSGMCYNK
nr:MAG TPA: hypothetical protein [Caudoviricetes sp.]